MENHPDQTTRLKILTCRGCLRILGRGNMASRWDGHGGQATIGHFRGKVDASEGQERCERGMTWFDLG